MPIHLTHNPEIFKTRSIRPQRYWPGWPKLLLALLWYGLPVAIAFSLPFPPSPRPDSVLAAPVVVLIYIATYYISLLFHEEGHALLGLMNKLKLVEIGAGPFHWQRTAHHGDRMSFNNWMQTQGWTVLLPGDEENNLPRRYLLAQLGGPLFTLVQVLMTFTVRSQITTAVPFWLAAFLNGLAFSSLGILLFTTLPVELVAGYASDMVRALVFGRGGATAEQQLALLRLEKVLWAEKRPSALPKKQLKRALQGHDKDDTTQRAHYLAYLQALDGGDPETAVTHLDRLLAHLRQQRPRAGDARFLGEAAYFEARYGQRPEFARQWLDIAERLPDGSAAGSAIDSFFLQRARVAVRLAEDDVAAATALALSAVTTLATITEAVIPVAELEWLTGLAEQATLDSPQVSRSRSGSKRPVRRFRWQTVILLLLLTWMVSIWYSARQEETPTPGTDAPVAALIERGMTLLEAEEYMAAVAEFDAAIALQPLAVDAYWNRGVAYFELGELEQAIADYSQVIAAETMLGNEPDPLIYLLRAESYSQIGEIALARVDYAQVLASGDEILQTVARDRLADLAAE